MINIIIIFITSARIILKFKIVGKCLKRYIHTSTYRIVDFSIEIG